MIKIESLVCLIVSVLVVTNMVCDSDARSLQWRSKRRFGVSTRRNGAENPVVKSVQFKQAHSKRDVPNISRPDEEMATPRLADGQHPASEEKLFGMEQREPAVQDLMHQLRNESRPFARVTLTKPIQLMKTLKQLMNDISWSMFEDLYRDDEFATKELLSRARAELEAQNSMVTSY